MFSVYFKASLLITFGLILGWGFRAGELPSEPSSDRIYKTNLPACFGHGPMCIQVADINQHDFNFQKTSSFSDVETTSSIQIDAAAVKVNTSDAVADEEHYELGSLTSDYEAGQRLNKRISSPGLPVPRPKYIN